MDAKKDAPAAGGTATGAGAERTGQGTIPICDFTTREKCRQALRNAAFECRRAAAILELEAASIGGGER